MDEPNDGRTETFAPEQRRAEFVAAVRSKRIIGLDVVRSVAILCVITFHFLLSAMPDTVPAKRAVSCLGTYGVELFFILSGYLIGGILIREVCEHGVTLKDIRHFWLRRWFRTLPNYYFYLLLAYLLERPWRHPSEFSWEYLFFLQNFAGWNKHFFPPTWSLAVEEWFYLLFPILLFAASSFKLSRQQSILLAVMCLLVVPPLLRGSIAGGNPVVSGILMTVVYRLDAIAFGVLLAYLRKFKPKWWNTLSSGWALCGGLALLAAMCWTLTALEVAANHVLSRFLNVSLLLAIDVSCFLILPWFAELSRMRPVGSLFCSWASALSYSLYLSHVLAITLIGGLLFRLGIGDTTPQPIRFFLWMLAALLMALASYHWIEKPFLRWRERIAPD